MAGCTDTARDKAALAGAKAVRGVVIGKCVSQTLARRKKGLGRSSIHVSTERVDSGMSCILNIACLDVEQVLLAARHPVAVALACDWDGESVHKRDVDACDGEVPAVCTGHS